MMIIMNYAYTIRGQGKRKNVVKERKTALYICAATHTNAPLNMLFLIICEWEKLLWLVGLDWLLFNALVGQSIRVDQRVKQWTRLLVTRFSKEMASLSSGFHWTL